VISSCEQLGTLESNCEQFLIAVPRVLDQLWYQMGVSLDSRWQSREKGAGSRGNSWSIGPELLRLSKTG